MHRNRTRSFLVKMLMNNLVLCMVPIIILGTAFFTLSFSNVKTNAINSASETLSRIVSDYNSIIRDTITVAEMISLDNEVQKISRKELPKDNKIRYSEKLDMSAWLYYVHSFYKGFYGFCIIGQNGGVFTNGIAAYKRDFRNESWYEGIIQNKDGLWFSAHTGSFAMLSAKKELISYGIPVVDRLTGSHLGIVLVDIDYRYIRNIINSEYLNLEIYDSLLVNELYQKLGVDYSDKENNLQKGVWNYSKDGAYCIETLDNGWAVVCSLSNRDIYKGSDIFISIAATTALMLVVLSICYSVSQANRFYDPIQQLKTTMLHVENGDFMVRVHINTKDELHELGISLNNMLDRIEDSIERERAIQKELRKAEFRALESQINPHFLYNTQDTINWMSRNNENGKIQKMIEALTSLFRTVLSKGNDFVTVSVELTNITSYLQIQKIRYASKLNYSIDAPVSLLSYMVVKLILQPIVENAIYHGIKEKEGQGNITIKVRESDGELVFFVQDDGIGMTEQRLALVRQMLRTGEKDLVQSYGMFFVHRRIQIYYGEDYGLTVESKYGKGTLVKIVVPKWGDKNNDAVSHN